MYLFGGTELTAENIQHSSIQQMPEHRNKNKLSRQVPNKLDEGHLIIQNIYERVEVLLRHASSKFEKIPIILQKVLRYLTGYPII